MGDDTFTIRVEESAAMAAGRRTLRQHVQQWGCTNVDDIVLVFSELITNVWMHTSGASTTVITHGPPNVRIGVHDASRSIPELRHDAPVGGHGLQIVKQLSRDWGWEQLLIGKLVWSTMQCGHELAEHHTATQRRTDRDRDSNDLPTPRSARREITS